MLAAPLILLLAQAAPPPKPRVDPVMAIEQSLVCREAPQAIQEARTYLLGKGWPDVTRPSVMSDTPTSYQFDRDGIWLVVSPFNASLAECHTHSHIPDGTQLAGLLPALTKALGRAPDKVSGELAVWNNIAGRKVEAGIAGGEWFNIFFRPANAEPTPDRMALTAASTAPSASADEIAAAATACMAAGDGVDGAALRGAGWSPVQRADGAEIYARKGSNVRILATRGQCVVDAYGQRRDSFDAIRAATQARLKKRFGGKLAVRTSTGHARSPSRGQGFTVGNRIGILSSEQRDDGLSIRFTVMTLQDMPS